MSKIGFLTFGRDELGYGMSLCLDRIKGYEVYRVTPKTAKLVDYLLFSCFWWEHIYLLADFLRRAGIQKGDTDRPRIIVGGYNTFNPVPFLSYADYVVCGDGEDILPDVLTGSDPGLIWRNTPSLTGFAQKGHNTTRIEIARGCRSKCKFCSVAHLKPYREAPLEAVKECLRRVNTKKVTLFAPDPTAHKYNDEINEFCKSLGLTRNDTDVRLINLDKYSGSSLPHIGLEGVSERLRRSVGKKITNDLLVKSMSAAIRRGKPTGILFYLILDLPGETEEDFWELREALIEIGKTPGADKFSMIFSPNMFSPMPHTGMETEGIHYEKNYVEQWKRFFGRGRERDWPFLMVEKTRIFSPGSRILNLLCLRGGDDFGEIERELTEKRIIRISAGRPRCESEKELVKCLESYGGVERFCGPWKDLSVAPWKRMKFEGQNYREESCKGMKGADV